MADNDTVVTNQNPHAVDPDLVDQPMKQVGDQEVSAEPLHTDFANVRADDPPAVAAKKIADAHERIADLQKNSDKAGASGGDVAQGTKSFEPAGTNKTASDSDSDDTNK